MPVQVNPNVPLSLEDFAHIYTGGGQTPQQNASNLWFNAPAEGRSYMEDQWSKLGTGTSPEQYFSDPAHVTAHLTPPQSGAAHPQLVSDSLGRIPVSPGNTGQEQWPMYASPAARITAMNLGMDQRGSYTTPDRMMAGVTSHLATAPHDPEHLLRDPQLQQMMAVDPTKAKFIYEKLTGASYDKDKAEVDSIDRTQKIADLNQKRKDLRAPQDFAEELVRDAIKHNAHYDPTTGKLMEWQQTAPDANAVDQRPVMQRVEVGPEKNRAWHSQAYTAVTGMPAPKANPPDPDMAAAKTAALAQPSDIQDKILSNRKHAEELLGRPMTSTELRQADQKTIEENKHLWGMNNSYQSDLSDAFVSQLTGHKGYIPGMPTDQFNQLPQTTLGRAANWIGNLQDRLSGMGSTDHMRSFSGPPQQPFNWTGDSSRSWLDRLNPFSSHKSPKDMSPEEIAAEIAALEAKRNTPPVSHDWLDRLPNPYK